MEKETPEINIEDIMDEIRKEAEALRYEEPVSFEDTAIPLTMDKDGEGRPFSLKELEDTLTHINGMWTIPYGHEISGNQIKKFLARAARKLNKPTGAPMAQDITRFNAEAAKAFNSILQYIRENEKKEEDQGRRIAELEAEIRRLKEQAEKKA